MSTTSAFGNDVEPNSGHSWSTESAVNRVQALQSGSREILAPAHIKIRIVTVHEALLAAVIRRKYRRLSQQICSSPRHRAPKRRTSPTHTRPRRQRQPRIAHTSITIFIRLQHHDTSVEETVPHHRTKPPASKQLVDICRCQHSAPPNRLSRKTASEQSTRTRREHGIGVDVHYASILRQRMEVDFGEGTDQSLLIHMIRLRLCQRVCLAK